MSLTLRQLDLKPKTIELFWAKVKKTTYCWLWLGGKNWAGYGRLPLPSGKKIFAHRLSYLLTHGAMPKGKEIDHLCRVRCCVNPSHLRCLTHRENTLIGTSFSAVNVRKTHCRFGHPFSGENLYVHPNGMRVCRTCLRGWRKSYEERNK